MKDSEKAKQILLILNSTELKFKNAREVFSFTKSYEWLLELAKKIEAEENKNANI